MAKIKTKNEAGEEIEVEVFTPEEVDAKLQEKDQEHQKVIAEKDNELSTAKQEKADLEAKMGDIKPDHPNFKTLKDALDKKDSDIKKLSEDIATDKKLRQTEEMDDKIKIATKGDAELEKKVKFHLENTVSGMKDDTKENRQKKLDAALKLSTDHSTDGPGIFDGGINDGGKGHDIKPGGVDGADFTPREKALGAKFGITAEDYKKYAGRVSKRQ